jgi:3-oxoacyl-[acyl-carrier-protein] synthase II
MNAEPIVVTGIGILSPVGKNVQENWNSLRNGISGVKAISRFDSAPFNTHFAAEIEGFDPSGIDHVKQLRKMDRLSWYALAACDEALNMAQLNQGNFKPDRTGVSWASGNGGIESIDEALVAYATDRSRPRFSPYFQSKALPDSASGWIASRYGFKGPNQLSVAACASSNAAILTAMLYLRAGLCDVMVAGGSDAPITPSVIGGFGAMKALSTRNDAMVEASRPFANSRDGFVLGEGGAALVLETLSHAEKRGANILAVLSGCGNANDAGHPTAADKDGYGTSASCRMALEMAKLDASEIQLINPHATSTPNGDSAEYNGFHAVFSDLLKTIPMSATKCMTGHLLGAAGAVEAAFNVLALQNQAFPAGINHFDTEISFVNSGILLCGKTMEGKIDHTLSHSAGFGGHNATVILSAPQAVLSKL